MSQGAAGIQNKPVRVIPLCHNILSSACGGPSLGEIAEKRECSHLQLCPFLAPLSPAPDICLSFSDFIPPGH